MFNPKFIFQTSVVSTIARSLCLAAGVGLFLSPSSLTAQEKKPAAEKKAEPADEEKPDAAPATPRSETVALKEFKSDMGALKKWTQAEKEKAKSNPMAGLKLIGEMNTKVAKVRTDGLPEDLSTQYKKMADVMKRMAAVFKGMPDDDAELMKWIQEKATDPGFSTKMQTLGKEAKETGDKLKEVGKKYGIDELDFDDRDKGSKEAKGDDDKEEGGKKEKTEK